MVRTGFWLTVHPLIIVISLHNFCKKGRWYIDCRLDAQFNCLVLKHNNEDNYKNLSYVIYFILESVDLSEIVFLMKW